LKKYSRFSIFQDGGSLPSLIFKVKNLPTQPLRGGGAMCVIMRYFAPIGQTIPEIWPFFDVSRWQLSAILDI